MLILVTIGFDFEDNFEHFTNLNDNSTKISKKIIFWTAESEAWAAVSRNQKSQVQLSKAVR